MTLVPVRGVAPCSDCGGGGVAGVIDASMSRDAYGDDRAVGFEVECTTCGGSGRIEVVEYEEDGEPTC